MIRLSRGPERSSMRRRSFRGAAQRASDSPEGSQKSAIFAALRGLAAAHRVPRCALAAVILLGAALPGACAPGDLYLATATAGAGSDDEASGSGDEGSDASACVDGDCASVCAGPSCGGRNGEGDGPCAPGGPPCQCAGPEECPAEVPICAFGECRECLEASHCLALFGGDKPVCWQGRCSACRSDVDCPLGLACRGGLCGVCENDSECPESYVCEAQRCRPL